MPFSSFALLYVFYLYLLFILLCLYDIATDTMIKMILYIMMENKGLLLLSILIDRANKHFIDWVLVSSAPW